MAEKNRPQSANLIEKNAHREVSKLYSVDYRLRPRSMLRVNLFSACLSRNNCRLVRIFENLSKYLASISPSLTLALYSASAAWAYSLSVGAFFFSTLAARARASRLVV